MIAMSDSLNDDAPQSTQTQTGGEMNGNAETAHASENNNKKNSSNADVMGDIGNPPFREHKEEKDKDKDKEAPPSNNLPSSPLSQTPPPPNDMEATRRGSSPIPPPNQQEDGDSVESESSHTTTESGTLDVSPAPIKRSMVLSGREHEDTDDFLLSTMLAIRTAVLAGTRDATKLEASPEDFCASRKHKISMAGDRKVEVKDYAPVVFTLVRRHFGVSIPAYLLSWSDSRLAKSKSAGKSDSMFIMSPDNKFVLKTLVREEAKRLCKILRPYYEHLIENKDTFLSRIYGLHRMSRRRGQSSIYFAIFNNVFDSGHSLNEIYDLKGSTVGRRASNETTAQRRSSTSFEFRQVRKAITEEQQQPAKKPSVLKDLDFTRKLHVGPENRGKVLAQLSKDCKFLSTHQLMDYSLLIGVRRTDTPNGTSIAPRSESPTPMSRNATPLSSPSPDQRVIPVRDGVPIIVPSSPRARHSIVVPSFLPASQRERVPGLLFFLESTKAATSKSLRETKRDRRKSVSEGGGSALLAQQELNAIEEEEAEENKKEAQQNSVAHPATDENNKPNDKTKTESTPTDTPQGTPPKSSTTAHQPAITATPTETPTIIINPPEDDDETEGTPPEINVIPPSPVGGRANGGNSGEVGHAVPPLKIAVIDKPTSPPMNGKEDCGKAADEDSDDDTSLMDSPNDSPRQSLGMMTVNSVPNFNYFSDPSSAPIEHSILKSGTSSLRIASPNTPNNHQFMKRHHRSSSLTYVNLDPLCGNPHIPFYKNADGGLSGATFVPLDANKSNEVYYIGLIDFLQKYNKKKKLAGFAKSFKYEKEELSTVDPNFYMERFLKMTERAIVE